MLNISTAAAAFTAVRRFHPSLNGGGLIVVAAFALAAFGAHAAPQEANGYTRYELLAPGSGAFRIVYDITAVRPGATVFFNPIRKGSVASEESVTDLATGAPLKFEVVSGEAARAGGLPEADLATDYIEVHLARPVPPDGGEGRIRIEKTYVDPKSYRVEGLGPWFRKEDEQIVFDRSLGIKKNALVLPAGYGLVSCNYPAQVLREADGRLKISFRNTTPAEAPLLIRARRVGVSPGASAVQSRLEDRAVQTRDIVYFLKAPETHSFDLYHDYTETKEGVGRYVNVVRTGSAASNPSARNLDTGETIPAQLLKGAAITAAGISEEGLTVTPDAEVVVFPFKPLAHGQSIRLRMSETYTDPERYRLVGDELIFDRTFGRPANAVVLPSGWSLTNSTAPATVSTLEDGRTRLDFLNPRTDEVEVLITARPDAITLSRGGDGHYGPWIGYDQIPATDVVNYNAAKIVASTFAIPNEVQFSTLHPAWHDGGVCGDAKEADNLSARGFRHYWSDGSIVMFDNGPEGDLVGRRCAPPAPPESTPAIPVK